MSESPNFNLNCPDGGRGYVAYHFGTVLKRYDYTQYINERLAGDFACTLAQHLENTKAREAKLQQRLTEADQQIDLLSPRHTEQPEGKREHFEKWVMATKHPVYGFLDGRSLARGDDRTGYADEYVQGLWVAYLAFGVEQPSPVAVVPELTPELRWILGQMCFQCIHTAQALRLMGHDIAKKAEDEQAVTIYWMLGHYLKDPANWRQNAIDEMKSAAPAA